MNLIKVKAKDAFVLRNYKNETVAEIEEGRVYNAKLYEPSGEYFAKDSQGREFYVGELDIEDNLKLDECFELDNVRSFNR